MSVNFRLPRQLALAALLCGMLWTVASPAEGKEAFFEEVLLSLAWPLRADESEAVSTPRVETRVAALPSGPPDGNGLTPAAGSGFPSAGAPAHSQDRQAVLGALLRRPALFPGNSSWHSLNEGAVKVASLGAGVPTVTRKAGSLLDEGERFASVGGLVGDPAGIFSHFVIEVERHAHTVELFGMRNGKEKKLLFSCRAGLGSAEYPTPSGQFYLVRIFDDRPLWIPPNSEWAWGQSPSHSVYGGHMMPLFKKARPKSKTNGEDVVQDLDIIEPQMEMKDTEGYRVHGTDSPWSIGDNQSHGCVRLLNKSVKQLADTLKMYVGTIERSRSANGSYVTLARPVRIILY